MYKPTLLGHFFENILKCSKLAQIPLFMYKAIKFVGVFLIYIFSTFVNAQSTQTWTNYRDLEAVKIDYTIQECVKDITTEFYFIKLTNKTSNEITVSFKIECYFNGSCSTCSNDEYYFTFKVPANGSIMPNCVLNSYNDHLAIIKRYVDRNYGPPLERFELSNITVQ